MSHKTILVGPDRHCLYARPQTPNRLPTYSNLENAGFRIHSRKTRKMENIPFSSNNLFVSSDEAVLLDILDKRDRDFRNINKLRSAGIDVNLLAQAGVNVYGISTEDAAEFQKFLIKKSKNESR